MTAQQQPTRKGHPHPLNLGSRAMKRLPAALFYTIIQDVAAGIQVRRPGGVDEISGKLRKDGLSQEEEDEAWKYIGKYEAEIKQIPYQNVVLQMFATWDWYAEKMKDFVSRGLNELGVSQPLANPLKQDWKSFSRKPIELQVTIFPAVAGVSIDLEDSTLTSLQELRLVRNLGVHSLWQVDEPYQRLSATGPWEIDELRKLPMPELFEWHGAILEAIKVTSVAMSKRFVDVDEIL